MERKFKMDHSNGKNSKYIFKKKIAAKRHKRNQMAAKINSPNGGVFHTNHFLRVKEWEEKKLCQRAEESAGGKIIFSVDIKNGADANWHYFDR